MRTFLLYLRLLGIHFRVLLQYQADFWIMGVATLLTQTINVVFLTAVFARVPTLQGWTFWAVLAMFGLVAVAEGVGSFFFEGTWRVAASINQGLLDYMIIRPYPIVLQLMSAEVGINGLSNILTGGAMIGVALAHTDARWSVPQVLLTIIVLPCAVAVKVAINLATNSFSFWLSSPNPMFAMAIHQVGDLAKYPLGIYPVGLRVILGIIVPFAFVGVFPAGFVMRSGQYIWLGVLTPLVAAYCVAAALLIFRRGLGRYESAGN